MSDPGPLGLDQHGMLAPLLGYELLDLNLQRQGWLHPRRDATSISFDDSRPIMRTLSGLELEADEAAEIDFPSARVRVWYDLPGADVTAPYPEGWPMGTFLFGTPVSIGLGTEKRVVANCLDLGHGVDQEFGRTVGVYAGSLVDVALAYVAGHVPVLTRDLFVEPSVAYVAEPAVWPGNTTALGAFNSIARQFGYFGLGFDGMGRPFARRVFDPDPFAPTIDYDATGNRWDDTVTTTQDLLNARDGWQVEVTAAQQLAVRGEFYLPVTHPLSRARRGFPTNRFIASQSLGSVVDADDAAASYAYGEDRPAVVHEFEAWADPRHDLYTVARSDGVNWLSRAWTFRPATMTMSHRMTRNVTP